MQDTKLKPGKYQHYSGRLYQVLGLGRHSETHEPMVIYQALYDSNEFGNNAFWIRPLHMFQEEIQHQGKTQRRFEEVEG